MRRDSQSINTGMTAKNLVIPAWNFEKVPSNLLKLFQSLTFLKLEGWNPVPNNMSSKKLMIFS